MNLTANLQQRKKKNRKNTTGGNAKEHAPFNPGERESLSPVLSRKHLRKRKITITNRYESPSNFSHGICFFSFKSLHINDISWKERSFFPRTTHFRWSNLRGLETKKNAPIFTRLFSPFARTTEKIVTFCANDLKDTGNSFTYSTPCWLHRFPIFFYSFPRCYRKNWKNARNLERFIDRDE